MGGMMGAFVISFVGDHAVRTARRPTSAGREASVCASRSRGCAELDLELDEAGRMREAAQLLRQPERLRERRVARGLVAGEVLALRVRLSQGGVESIGE